MILVAITLSLVAAQACSTYNTCEACAAANCTVCIGTFGGFASLLCSNNGATCNAPYALVASCSPNYTTCVAAPAANKCGITATQTVFRGAATSCGTVNTPPTVFNNNTATTGVTNCQSLMAQSSCINSIQTWSCTYSCKSCDPLNNNTYSGIYPCQSVCDGINTGCSAAIAAGCFNTTGTSTLPPCGPVSNCAVAVAYNGAVATSAGGNTGAVTGTVSGTSTKSSAVALVASFMALVVLLAMF